MEAALNTLADRQMAFAKALLEDSEDGPQGLVVPSGISVRQRFSIYRNNVAVGLVESVRSSFPVVERLVGGEFFRAMARAYTRDELPASPVLFTYGEGFPHFIAAFPPAVGLPYLADVARLEWQWVQAYHAEDAEPVAIDALQGFPVERMPALCLVLHPAVAMLSCQHPAVSIWRSHQDDLVSMADLAYVPEIALVWRIGVDVCVIDISPGTFAFLDALRLRQPLGHAAEAALRAERDIDLPELIQRMFRLHVFVAVVEEVA